MTMPLSPGEKLKRKWVRALRSGKYHQGFGGLRHAGGSSYCCLGVLADVVNPNGWVPNKIATECDAIEINGSIAAYLLGIPDLPEAALTDMNDEQRKSFAEIADWIEANIDSKVFDELA